MFDSNVYSLLHTFLEQSTFDQWFLDNINAMEPYLSNNEFINETKINEVHEKYNEGKNVYGWNISHLLIQFLDLDDNYISGIQRSFIILRAFSLTLGKTLDFVELNKAMNEMKINEVCEKDNENIIMCSWCLECNNSYCKCRPEKRSNDGYCLKCGRFRCKKTNYGNYKLGPHKFNYKGKLIK
ncbi:hypothetical protein RhiirA4_465744 [Rhizophagus irregularis]|uniref:Uncharacterized protein n=1 Tax=Rhizophagus irregularis TaxID=588596 RepID=A0A2I1GSP7_9GLOM|nr:hypothetical protein RhiirA4_465744 [Rhizophagus irregularis]